MPFVDDLTILDAEQLLRRIHPTHWVSDGAGGLRPSSAAFSDPELSVDLSSEIIAAGKTLIASLTGYPGFALASITAGQARAADQVVCKDPLPLNSAHAIVAGDKTTARRRQLAKASIWVQPPPP